MKGERRTRTNLRHFGQIGRHGPKGVSIRIRPAHIMTKVSSINPKEIAAPMGYSHVVSIESPKKILYISGQISKNQSGEMGEWATWKRRRDRSTRISSRY
jgi:hypothetical protein